MSQRDMPPTFAIDGSLPIRATQTLTQTLTPTAADRHQSYGQVLLGVLISGALGFSIGQCLSRHRYGGTDQAI